MATTDKIRKDIAKTKEKISQLQTKLRTLETQLTEEENLEIVRMVKAVKMDNRELTAFLRAYKSFLFFGSAIKKNIKLIFYMAFPLQRFHKKRMPHFIRLLWCVLLFPLPQKMEVIRQYLVAMIFFLLIFRLRSRLSDFRSD